MTFQGPRRRLAWAGLLLGAGMGGFFDGIVLHQILQWHHMLTSEGSHPADTVAGLEANTLADGLFHAATYIFVCGGLWLLWRGGNEAPGGYPAQQLFGLILMGWGGFNLIEGTVNHHLLTLHHVREDSSRQAAWDFAFLVWGAVMLAVGWLLARSAHRSVHESP